jgi:hypothetical protein
MPIANAYREAPATPKLTSTFGCSMLSGQPSDKDALCATKDATPSPQQELKVSLFGEAKKQRYEKFRDRVRSSMSPRNNLSTPGRAQQEENRGKQFKNGHDVQSDEQQTYLKSYEDKSDDKYTLKKAGSQQQPQTNVDTYVFPYNRDFATAENGQTKSKQQNISSRKGSAFGTPISSSFRQYGQSPANTKDSKGRKDTKLKELPGPPSVATQASSHMLNTYRLPIASAHHGPSTPQAATDDELPPSVVKVDNSRRATGTRISNSRSFATPTPEPNTRTKDDGQRGNAMGAISYLLSNNAARTPSPYAGHHSARLAGSFHSKPPNGLSTDNRQRPGLLVNTRSTPTSKPPPMTFSYSSERGVTPPPQATQKTPMSLEGSEGTSSTAKRDRILESRGVSRGEERMETREPLNEMRRTPMGQVGNISERRSPAPSLELNPSLDMPSLKSTYSTGPNRNTPWKTPQKDTSKSTETKGVTPLDFYRRIAAERTNQVAMAKRRTGLTPTNESSTSQRTPPVFRSESPRCSSVPALDQRTVRVLYSKHFDKMVREHMTRLTRAVLQQATRRNDQQGQHGVSVFARKRPLLEDEAANGEFDVVNADTGQANAMIVYVTSMLSDLQTKDVQANLHEFDHVFAESRLAEDFYMRVAREGVMRAREGGAAAFVVFGSSGSGKTHSMADIEERAAYELFETSRGTRPISVSVQYLFLTGDNIVDLLGPTGSPVHVVDEGGRLRIKGSSDKKAFGPRELLEIMSDVRRRLFRASTLRRQEIAEGFILCNIVVHHKWAKGSLILIKCPSYELSNGDGNATMFNELMQGIRAKARGGLQDHHFRGQSNISKIMQDIFNDHLAQISLLATVSPAASSTEETLAVLDSLSLVASRGAQAKPAVYRESPPPKEQENESPKSVGSANELTLPRQWSRDELDGWMKRRNLLGKPVPPDVNGRLAMRMSKNQLKNAFYDGKDLTKAERLHMALRAENDRVARMRVKVRMAQERQRMVEQY